MQTKPVKQGKKRGDDVDDEDEDDDYDDEGNVCDIVPRSSWDALMTGLDAEAG